MDEFLARLAKLQPDLGGTARLEMTDIPRPDWRHCWEVLAAQGWAFDTIEYEQRRVYWVLNRPGTETVGRRDPYFVKGPSLTELRRHPQAREAAAHAKRDLGVDPLSDTVLREVRARHLRLYRKGTRYAGTAAVCGMALLVVLVTAWRHLGSPAVFVPAAVLLIGLITGWVVGARALRERKAAVKPFREAYERVVSAVMKRPS